jgi:SAM-dependent methyltransferase
MPKGRESGMPDEAYWASFFQPESVLDALELTPGCGDVVEFGCGYGTFTLPAARRTSGVVQALDIEPEMIAATSRLALEAGLANVRTELRDFVSTGCGRVDGSAAYVMLFNILHIEAPVSLLREAHRVLSPGGLCGVMHWNYDPTTPRGPSMEIRPRPEQCRAWGEAAGFEFVRFANLPGCPYHYGLLLRKPKSSQDVAGWRAAAIS